MLNETETALVYSNEEDDKIPLISHGLLNDFYYFIYQDQIELFRFSSGAIEYYPFDETLDLNRSQKDALSMSRYGLVIIPRSEEEGLKFYSLTNRRLETISSSVSHHQSFIQLDSFILYTTVEEGVETLFSHNILQDEIHILYLQDSVPLEIFPQNGLVFFGDRKKRFVTKGSPENTYDLGNYFGFSLEPVSYQKGQEAHIFLNLPNDEFRYIQIIWHEGIVDSYSLPPNSILSYVTHFNRIDTNKLLLATRLDRFIMVNMRNDSLNSTKARRIYNLTFDRANAYFNGNTLNEFNYDNQEVTALSEMYLNDHIQDIEEIYKVNDSIFYLIGHNKGRFKEGLNSIFAFDLTRDTIIELISFENQHHGLEEARLIQLEQELILRTQDTIYKWTGNDFKPLFPSNLNLPILNHRGKYYFVQKMNNTAINIYEWKEQDEIVAVAKNIPFYERDGSIINVSDQIIILNRFFGAFLVDTENGTYDTLSPYDMENPYPTIYAVKNYIIMEVGVPGRDYEFWAYHLDEKSWTQLETENIQRPETDSEYPNQAGDYLINIEFSSPNEYITSTSMRTGEQVILLNDNNPNTDYFYTIINSCDGKAIIHEKKTKSYSQKLFSTDGTTAGTQELLDIAPSSYYNSFYNFDGDLIFTAIDEGYTQVFRLSCSDGLIEQALELDPFVPQQQFRINQKLYTLGYKLFPEQNLTLSRMKGTQVNEILVSPYDNWKAADLSLFESATSRQTISISDSHIVISVSLDEKGEELWSISSCNIPQRITDLNEGPFDSDISNLIVFDEHLYFTGYQYGVGKQAWRMPLPVMELNEQSKDLQLLIAPNPSDQFLTICELPLERGEVSIFDMSGKFIFNGIKEEGVNVY